MRCLAFLLALLFTWTPGPPAHADETLHSYALIVGSNRGGPGQRPLDYAEDDAERVGSLLVELGRVPAQQVRLLSAPSSATLRKELGELRRTLSAHAERGERAQLVFYYSGHARANALSLGDEEFAIAELRAVLTGLPSTLTVVVLDACQSGAFSGVKGAHPVADFSQVSVSSLRSEGLAVMASSTEVELSQESHELGAGYFTHHLLVGLRGAGDVDRDGRVSLDEAYRYAYTQTLSSTALTRVGMQHATLETAISGRGDVPLSYPTDADAQLVLPAATEGRVLVQLPGRGAIVAELAKARGTELALALPAGSYDVLVRESGVARALSCAVQLVSGQREVLGTSGCRTVVLEEDTQKKDGAGKGGPFERWFGEFGISFSQRVDDAYSRAFETFGFATNPRWDWLGGPWDRARDLHVSAAAGLGLTRHFALLVRFDGLERMEYQRYDSAQELSWKPDVFRYRTHALMAGLRGRYPLFDERFVPYVEAGGGLGFSRSVLDNHTFFSTERSFGPALRAAAGFSLGRRVLGTYLAGGFVYAPISQNHFGQRHNDGGGFVELGLRFHGFKGQQP